MTTSNAQRYFGVVAGLVGAGLVLQLGLSATAEGGSFGSVQGRIVNFFCFFTVLSNITVAITHGLLAVDLDRPSTAFKVMRIVGVLCILVTGVVFHLALASLQELTGWDLVADTILHTFSPILAAVGWVVFGPRGWLDGRLVRLAILPPVGWLVFALVRGSFVQDVNGNDYYAYPFMNAQVHGYATALFRCAMVAVLFLGLAYGALAADRRLPGIRSER
ncbi:MAG: Pr6Pr family membrane protein [Acidimicrobiales bacterium]